MEEQTVERADLFMGRMDGNPQVLNESYLREQGEGEEEDEVPSTPPIDDIPEDDLPPEEEMPKEEGPTDIGYFLQKGIENSSMVQSYVDMASEQIATLNEQEKAGLKGMLSKTQPKNASEAGAIAVMNYLVK